MLPALIANTINSASNNDSRSLYLSQIPQCLTRTLVFEVLFAHEPP
jgi:hypothetical protein